MADTILPKVSQSATGAVSAPAPATLGEIVGKDAAVVEADATSFWDKYKTGIVVVGIFLVVFVPLLLLAF